MLASICQLRLFTVMRSFLTAVVLAVMAISGPAWLQPTSLDAWENTGRIRTLWADTYAVDILASEVLRRQADTSYDTAPWRPLVLGRPPNAAQDDMAGLELSGSDADHPPPGLRLAPPARLVQAVPSLFHQPVALAAFSRGPRAPPTRG